MLADWRGSAAPASPDAGTSFILHIDLMVEACRDADMDETIRERNEAIPALQDASAEVNAAN
jgi:hypothetical protein